MVTSPYEFSRISSGDASPIVILVKLFFTFVSFLKAMFFYYFGVRLLFQFHAQAKATKFVEQHVE